MLQQDVEDQLQNLQNEKSDLEAKINALEKDAGVANNALTTLNQQVAGASLHSFKFINSVECIEQCLISFPPLTYITFLLKINNISMYLYSSMYVHQLTTRD